MALLGEHPPAREQVQDGSGHLLPADSRSQRTATMIQKKCVAGLGVGLGLRGSRTPRSPARPTGLLGYRLRSWDQRGTYDGS
jgi:hypothetical protein